MIRPCGTTVLIEVEHVEAKTKGGIIMHSQAELRREMGGRDVGRVISFGPLCYKDFNIDSAGWGVKVGDLVEFNRYDGKVPRLSEDNEKYKNYRLISDNDIIAVEDGE